MGDIVKMINLDQKKGGMASLAMCQTQPKGRSAGGCITFTVEPSRVIENKNTRIHVQVNDHYQIDEACDNGRIQLFDLVKKEFEESINQADRIVNQLKSLTME